MSFNTSPISFINGGQISTLNNGFSAASISDRNGNILFYSDGQRVWNRNNIVMPNGFGLLGIASQINTVLIVPFINDSSKYHLFVSWGSGNNSSNNPSQYQYSYNIVDMQLNGSLGDVTNKNTFIQYFATENMVAIPNANGNDIWWICRDWTNHFYSYKITCTGFQNNNPVISTVGRNINNDANLLGAGDIKASSDGKFIAVSYNTYSEIYRFNSNTGILSNPTIIPSNFESYGIEFSPNSKLIYITGQEVGSNGGSLVYIRQYNLNTFDSIAINSSSYRVDSLSGSSGLQLGPDNKIYNNDGGEAVDVINNPNVQGAGCNFQDSIIVLPNGAFRRFPYSYVNLITAQNVQINYTVASNCRTVTFSGKTFIKGNNLTFKWKFNPTDSITQIIPSMGDTTTTSTTFTFPPGGTDSFFVNLTVTSDTVCGTGRAATKVVLKQLKPTANFNYTTTCNNLNVQFTNTSLPSPSPSLSYNYAHKLATAANTSYTNFSTAASPNFIFTSLDSIDVRLIVTNPNSCIQKDTIVKRLLPGAKPTAGFSAINTCGSLQVILNSTATALPTTATQEYYYGNILLGTGANITYNFSTYASYEIKHVVKYSATCVSDTFKKIITLLQAPQLYTTPNIDTSTAVGLPIQLAVSGAATYTWQPSSFLNNTTSSNPIFTASAAGNYPLSVQGTTAQGCKSNKSISIKVIASSNAVLIPNTFTPNGDNLNDKIKLTCSGLQSLSYFTIYNRYGETVYTQTSCNAKGWDGTYKNTAQPQGVYVYTWAGIDFRGNAVNGKGTIMLVQ